MGGWHLCGSERNPAFLCRAEPSASFLTQSQRAGLDYGRMSSGSWAYTFSSSFSSGSVSADYNLNLVLKIANVLYLETENYLCYSAQPNSEACCSLLMKCRRHKIVRYFYFHLWIWVLSYNAYSNGLYVRTHACTD